MTFGPYAIARVDGKAVLIPAAMPGDVVEIETQSQMRDYAMARVVRIIEPAPHRREPPCPYAATCGGCDWQQIQYEAQARLKGQVLAAAFRPLNIELDPDGLVAAAPTEFGYRSRVRLKTGPGGRIGFYHLRSNSLVEIEACLVAGPSIAGAAGAAQALGRNCTEVEVIAGQQGEVLVAHLTKAPGAIERKIARQLVDAGIAGLILRCGAIRELFGDVRIGCEVEAGCVIEADADLFSQVNQVQNRELVTTVMQLAEVSPTSRVLDLFCGSGNFSLPAARRGADIIGLDRDPLAIETARLNAGRMQLERTQFIAMRAIEGLRFLLQTGYCPDTLIIDPPRAGAADIIELIKRLKARKLIYVSCNPSTLVRDLRQMLSKGYEITYVHGLDFFPNTHHFEIVTGLLLT
jgi:23S rRNA (uracil1939-C5)-methyltransferase